MRTIILILLFGCATKPSAPSWVQGIRSGEERLQVKNGPSLLYRRIASGCERAIKLAEQDIRVSQGDVPYVVEHVYQDYECAVTLSVKPSNKPVKQSLTMSQVAEKYALTGTSRGEFERHIKGRVVLDINYQNQCWQNFYRSGASYHGSTTVCWKFGAIVGYCLQEGCYSKE